MKILFLPEMLDSIFIFPSLFFFFFQLRLFFNLAKGNRKSYSKKKTLLNCVYWQVSWGKL